MTQAPPLPRSDLVDTPWQACAGLRAGAIDGAASMIVMEVLIDALTSLPEGRAALSRACGRRAGLRGDQALGASAAEVAAGALARALIENAAASEASSSRAA